MTNYIQYIKDNTIRCETSHRGGGIEISLDKIIGGDNGYKMSAYQNYLGGGMLGKICNSYDFELDLLNKSKQLKIEKITEALNKYFHNLTNHADNEWENQTYLQNQSMPASAY